MPTDCQHNRTVPVVDKKGKPDNFAPMMTRDKPMSKCLDCGRLLVEGKEIRIKRKNF